MTYAEAVKEAEYWFPQCDESAMEALAVLTALAEENERLKSENADIRELWKRLKAIPATERDKENATLKTEVKNLQVQLTDYASLAGDLIERNKKAEAALAAAGKK